MSEFNDQAIISAWHENASPWIEAVRSGAIRSRQSVTNEAIVAVIRRLRPTTLLDVGCGEGWLARALAPSGIRVHGFDAVPQLIEAARRAGGGTFECLSYEAFAAGAQVARAELAVCNFSLLGDAATRGVVRRLASVLPHRGRLLIQTLHPSSVAVGRAPAEGWREGSWVGCGDGFGRAAPWYFRTLQRWRDLLQDEGFLLCATHEPSDPATGLPISVIFEAATAVDRQ